MVLEETSIICNTCVKQGILLSGHHPVGNAIIRALLEKLALNMAHNIIPTDKQVDAIVNFMHSCGIQETDIDLIYDVQEKAADLGEDLDIKSLVVLGSMNCGNTNIGSTFKPCVDRLSSIIFQKCSVLYNLKKSNALSEIKKQPVNLNLKPLTLKPKHILQLLYMIESGVFTDEKQSGLMIGYTRSLAKYYLTRWAVQVGPIPMQELLGIVLHFFYLDVYDDYILDLVYTDNRIIVPRKKSKSSDELRSENTYTLKRRLEREADDQQTILNRRAFLMMDGILSVNYPSYPKASRKLDAHSMLRAGAWFGKCC